VALCFCRYARRETGWMYGWEGGGVYRFRCWLLGCVFLSVYEWLRRAMPASARATIYLYELGTRFDNLKCRCAQTWVSSVSIVCCLCDMAEVSSGRTCDRRPSFAFIGRLSLVCIFAGGHRRSVSVISALADGERSHQMDRRLTNCIVELLPDLVTYQSRLPTYLHANISLANGY